MTHFTITQLFRQKFPLLISSLHDNFCSPSALWRLEVLRIDVSWAWQGPASAIFIQTFINSLHCLTIEKKNWQGHSLGTMGRAQDLQTKIHQNFLDEIIFLHVTNFQGIRLSLISFLDATWFDEDDQKTVNYGLFRGYNAITINDRAYIVTNH